MFKSLMLKKWAQGPSLFYCFVFHNSY